MSAKFVSLTELTENVAGEARYQAVFTEDGETKTVLFGKVGAVTYIDEPHDAEAAERWRTTNYSPVVVTLPMHRVTLEWWLLHMVNNLEDALSVYRQTFHV